MVHAQRVDQGMPVIELLLPRTDLAVLLQLVSLLAVISAGLWWTRRSPDLRLVVIGSGLLLLALLGLRAAH